MKIRQGFVSNSSSSSFVIRGIEMDRKELSELLRLKIGHNKYDDLDAQELWDKKELKYLTKDLDIRESDESEYNGICNDVIFGKNIMYLEDGIAEKLPKIDDKPIKEKLEKLLGKEIEELDTYIQFTSG